MISKGRIKVVSVIVAMMLAFTMVPALAFAAPVGTAEISVGAPQEGIKPGGFEAGDVLTFPVTLADNPGFSSTGIAVVFDTDVFEYVSGSASIAAPSIFASSDWSAEAIETSTSLGVLSVMAMYLPGIASISDFTGNGLLYTFQLKVVDDAPEGNTTISVKRGVHDLPGNFANMSLQHVPVNLTSFDITIKGEDEPVADPATVSVGTVSGTVAPGATFIVPVSIADNTGFNGAVFTLGYDRTALELVSFNTTGMLFAGSLNQDLDSASILWMNFATAQTANGVLFEATFKVLAGAADGNYQITVGLKESDPLNFTDDFGRPLAVEFAAGSVQVKAPIVVDGTTIVIGDGNLVTVNPGDIVVVPVSIVNNPGFASGGFGFSFDSTALELISINQSAELAAEMFIDNVNNARFTFIRYTNVTDDITLLNLIFKVKDDAADGDYVIGISTTVPKTLFLSDGATAIAIPFEVIECEVQVVAIQDLDLDLDLDMPAFDSGTTWQRVYNGSAQAINISLNVGGGIGNVTVYYNGSTVAPTNVGSYAVTVTTSGVPNYRDIVSEQSVGTLEIIKAAAPTITWPTASNITYGQVLNASVLTGGSVEFGSFAWDSSVNLGSVPLVGSYSYQVNFTPNANTLANYETIPVLSQNVTVTVVKAAAPDFVWPTASVIRSGQTLSNAGLSFTYNEYGSFVWANPSYAPAAPGENCTVTFIPFAYTSANYEPVTPSTKTVFVRVILAGDIDGDGVYTAADAMLILQHAAGLITLTGDAFIAADYDSDGNITAADALLVARKAAGLD